MKTSRKTKKLFKISIDTVGKRVEINKSIQTDFDLKFSQDKKISNLKNFLIGRDKK